MTSDTVAMSYRLPVVTTFTPLSPPARARARDGAYTPKPGNQPVTSNSVAPPVDVTILRHCRCVDCEKFFRDGLGESFCAEGIGGTKVCWGTGERVCDPPAESWHYCACYSGPQISKDIYVVKREA